VLDECLEVTTPKTPCSPPCARGDGVQAGHSIYSQPQGAAPKARGLSGEAGKPSEESAVFDIRCAEVRLSAIARQPPGGYSTVVATRPLSPRDRCRCAAAPFSKGELFQCFRGEGSQFFFHAKLIFSLNFSHRIDRRNQL